MLGDTNAMKNSSRRSSIRWPDWLVYSSFVAAGSAAAGFLDAFFSPEAALAFLAAAGYAGYIRFGLLFGLGERSPSQRNFLLLLLLLPLLGDVLALNVAYRLNRRRAFSLSFITSHRPAM